jgi:Rieske Fe-S protein
VPFQTQQWLRLAALTTTAGRATRVVAAGEKPPGSDERPQKADLLRDEDTSARAVDGIIACPAICALAGSTVTDCVKGEGSLDNDVFRFPCHNSGCDPREGARVVFRPPPRRLAALPLAVGNGSLTVAAPFIGKVGAQRAG